ncbi:hypothetical protein CAOG_00388 [Capsaspora owczarzaki ATCC 30864]|uniref:IF rod domain-containing protein n=1 Tax=Capsaspora owczarzaki (strain ATCC 30864) TaxID=595528 RepID=A0A0D2X0C2_CAPO3|nr:hypothetical protein CAOG_00388 [Capsaspora owczarzaki ATCC 30864]KJE88804.1 hypothetical protein CAOG_000388 [Capsaspora owczarzaki ATCC 30864]|eukprot:XP_004365259.1 hypothetical protein CAOG_00388 [Capsaspora owczarzaki ATCC 30864]
MSSPDRAARLEEKEELQFLNSKLELYIHRRQELQTLVKTLESELERERNDAQQRLEIAHRQYEATLTETRHALDKAASEASHASSSLVQVNAELAATKERARTESSAADALRSRYEALQLAKHELDGRLAVSEIAIKELKDNLKHADSDRKHAEKESDALRKSSEKEAQARIAAENALARFKQDAQASAKTGADLNAYHSEEMRRLRSDLSSLERKLRAEHDQELAEALSEHRRQTEAESAQYRAEVQALYESRLEAAREQAVKDASVVAGLQQALSAAQAAQDRARAEVTALSQRSETLSTRVRTLEHELIIERDTVVEVQRLREEATRLMQEAIAAKDSEVRTLTETNVALDKEIAMYRTLLEVEEKRLGEDFTPTRRGGRDRAASTSVVASGATKRTFSETAEETNTTPVRSKRRREEDPSPSRSASSSSATFFAGAPRSVVNAATRALFTSSASSSSDASSSSTGTTLWTSEPVTEAGLVVFEPVNLVEHNKLVLRSTNPEEEVSLHGWKVRTTSETTGSATYEIPAGIALSAEHPTVTIWTGVSATRGKRKSRSELLWKQDINYASNGACIQLLDNEDNEIARLEVREQKEDELFERQSDPRVGCSIM